MTRLIICEKPAVASDFARVFGLKKRGDGFIELKDGSLATWAVGHMLQIAEPEEMNESWKGYWSWAQLPMVPSTWKMVPNKKTFAQLKVIKELLKTAKEVVIATDAGREGELIAREILDYYKYKGPVSRFWAQDLTDAGIKSAWANLLPGEKTEGLHQAALARSHADWLVGFTGSRAATLSARVSKTAYPVGRVQTPVLAMVVERHEQITNFKKRAYYDIEAMVETKSGKSLTLGYMPKEEKRIYDPAVALEICDKIQGYSGPIKVTKSAEKESAPLPYNLGALQKDANKILGLSAATTLSLTQNLYEAKAVTYPRTDCSHLPSSMKSLIPSMVDIVSKTLYLQVETLNKMGVVLRDSTFDDSKLKDHFGIVPTLQYVPLSGQELQLFNLIAVRFLQSIAPDRLFDQTKVLLQVHDIPLTASGRVITREGWRSIKL